MKASLPITTLPGWRGDGFNNDGDDRGWTMTFRLPFDSLALSAPPSQGTLWRLAVAVHDRDSAAGPMNPDRTWPEAAKSDDTSTWGLLSFGRPTYTPAQTIGGATVTIRQGLVGATVPDAAVGGATTCGAGLDFWTQWGDTNYSGQADFNIQNQSDVADWPCFSKYRES